MCFIVLNKIDHFVKLKIEYMVALLYKTFKAWFWRAEVYALRTPGRFGRCICVLNACLKNSICCLDTVLSEVQTTTYSCLTPIVVTYVQRAQKIGLPAFAFTTSMSIWCHDRYCVKQTLELSYVSFSGMRLFSNIVSPRGSRESHSKNTLKIYLCSVHTTEY